MGVKNMDAIQDKLQRVFGYEAFREEQAAIIQNVLDGNNTFVIMPTGGGKSLCYQIPALIQEGLAIIISPLIALMKNQVDQLHALGVKATFLNSTLSKKAINAIKEDTLNQTLKLLYVAPESLIKEENLSFLKQANLSFVAIDEAHCISDWGHDFRPEYRNIRAVIKEELGALPIIALTATATPKVQQDILKNLSIENATVFKASFNRTNLYYEIQPKNQVDKQLVQFIQNQSSPVGIVYCQSRKKVEEIATLLNVNGIKAAPYHAGLDANVRIANQDAFLGQEIDVIVATIAFGMGIDKPNVRFVIHHDIPRSLEGYYQETGRAGRDGTPGNCLMLYSTEDVTRLAKLNKGKPAAEREKAKFLLQEMEAYTRSGVCRRKLLLHYFGETFKSPCNNCDNCSHPTVTFDGQPWVKMLLEAVQTTKELCHPDHIIKFLRGIEDSYIQSYRHQELPLFGQGREKSEEFWQSVIQQTQLAGLLSKGIDQAAPIKLTAPGKKFIAIPYAIVFYEDKVYQPINPSATSSPQTPTAHDEELLQLLNKLR
ncbi:MAG: RecQ family ATP-dependent DNA helicase, partial [Bacteroidota bacterium]